MVSYVLAKRFVFESGWLKEKPRFEFVAYLFGCLIGAIITAFIFALMASLGFNNILFQKVVSGVISFFTVFVYRNYIVFRKKLTNNNYYFKNALVKKLSFPKNI